MRRVAIAVSALALVLVMTSPARADTIIWTDWTAAVLGTPGSASGTMGGVAVGYTGQVSAPTQVAGGINYWNPATPYLSATVGNAPPCCDIITMTGGAGTGTSTITFGSPVTNPIMAIVSLGRPNVLVEYTFGQEFDVLSFGEGYWGGPGTLTELAGNVLRGQEGHGAIQFLGTYSSISWTAAPGEYWHGFTVGQVPEPAMLGLLGMGLVAAARRRFRK